ncbi:MAG: hypothetical protein WA667_05420 [Candidatus Nitrosopolaris sp.]
MYLCHLKHYAIYVLRYKVTEAHSADTCLAEILRSKKENITITNVYDEYLSIIIRNARRLKELTDNILSIAQIESKSMDLNKEVGDIDNVIVDTA